jgi:hypothetical protein
MRSFMEPRFGHDFSRVRVHSGSRAADSARAVNALAYTAGNNIVFGANRYTSETVEGRHLLAHELAHVIQQRWVTNTPLVPPVGNQPGNPLEHEANRAAQMVLSGSRAHVTGTVATPTLQLTGPGDLRHVAQRPVEGGHIEVVRTLEEQPCRRESQPESTPAGNVLFFDPDANAFGIRYRYCTGSTEVSTRLAIDYSLMRADAEQLLRQLPSTTARGGDVLEQIRQTARQTRIGGRASIAVTVSGTLRAEIRGRTEAGPEAQEYQVEGLLRLTPSGDWALELSGGAEIARQLGGQEVTFTFTPTVDIGRVQVGAGVTHTRREEPGTPPTQETHFRGTVTIPVTERLGIRLQGSSESGGSFSITFGTIDRPRRVRVPEVTCYVCVCPPPRPSYRCTRVRDPHTMPEVVQQAGREIVQLRFIYDSDLPTDRTTYLQQIDQIAGLVSRNYTVQSIRGFASPEATERYNVALAQRRADAAREDIRDALSRAATTGPTTLPPAQGVGELLGRSESGREVRNVDLVRQLTSRLRGLTEEEQLTLLGIDHRALSEPERVSIRERIQAFIRGTEEGRRLTRRARWERIFPFLRRVEVELSRREITRRRQVPRRRTPMGNCDAETLRWARENMPRVPVERRLPPSSGRC